MDSIVKYWIKASSYWIRELIFRRYRIRIIRWSRKVDSIRCGKWRSSGARRVDNNELLLNCKRKLPFLHWCRIISLVANSYSHIDLPDYLAEKPVLYSAPPYLLYRRSSLSVVGSESNVSNNKYKLFVSNELGDARIPILMQRANRQANKKESQGLTVAEFQKPNLMPIRWNRSRMKESGAGDSRGNQCNHSYKEAREHFQGSA